MAGTFVPSERKKIYVEDVQGGASVSESVASKLSSTMNFILDKIVQVLQFGVTGKAYSGLATPYTFSANSEVATENLLIQRVTVSNQISGISGQTEFRLERRLFGGVIWTTMFSTNCIISNTAIDNLYFNSDDMVAPAGVTLPVLSITTLAPGDEVRMVLISAANQAQNLLVDLKVSPT
jgi:hypothetical protein